MFINKLDKQQQGILLSLAEIIIDADGKVSVDESSHIKAIKEQMTPDVTPVSCSLSNLSNSFTSTSAKSALLLELIGLAHADSEYHRTEKDIISNIADALSISEMVLSDMESWVCRQFSLVREAAQFMEN